MGKEPGSLTSAAAGESLAKAELRGSTCEECAPGDARCLLHDLKVRQSDGQDILLLFGAHLLEHMKLAKIGKGSTVQPPNLNHIIILLK